jgi:hypothetical protein
MRFYDVFRQTSAVIRQTEKTGQTTVPKAEYEPVIDCRPTGNLRPCVNIAIKVGLVLIIIIAQSV